jgi:hypothetical protein
VSAPESWVVFYDETRRRGGEWVTTRFYVREIVEQTPGGPKYAPSTLSLNLAARWPSMEAALLAVRPFKRATRKFNVEKVES